MFVLPRTTLLRYSFEERYSWKVLPSAHNATCRKIAARVSGIAPSARGSSTCVCVPTVYTTARIAGKPATSPSLGAVVTELKNLHLLIDADMRLAAAVGGVAHHLADAAGLEIAAVNRLQAAVIAACQEAFKQLTLEHPHLEITFARFPDRIEVVLSHKGEGAPAAGVEPIAGPDGQSGGDSSDPGALAGVDRVQYETHGGESVTRLTKYLGKVAPGI